MDQWIRDWFRDSSTVGGTFTPWEVLYTLFLSFFLAMLLAYTYRNTHRGLSYSVSFVHTIVIMTVTVSVIMLIIGSNLARAFALVGALSIIRFRTAIKDPRDVAFIFMSMAAGMAVGTRFTVVALIFTLFMCPMVYFLYRFDIGAMPSSEVLLKVHLPEDVDHRTAFDSVFARFLREHSLLSVETIRGGTLVELVYSVQLKPAVSEGQLLDALRAVNGGNKVVLMTSAQNVNV